MQTRRAFTLAATVPLLGAQNQMRNMFGNARDYDRFMGRWSRLIAPGLIDFTAPPDSGRILDAGSGTGSLAFAIADRKPDARVLGIDPSKEYVTYANSKNPFPDRVTFEARDAQNLQYPSATFEASLSLLVFNFIPDPNKALFELRRSTKPGGRIAAAVWDYGAGMQMLRLFWDAAVAIDPEAEKLDEKHMPLCRAGDLSDLWKRGGLENVRERPIDTTMRFKSFPDYWDGFLLRQGPAGSYAAGLAPDKLHALRTELKHRLAPSAKKAPAEESPFALPARVWAVRGNVPKTAR